MLEFKSTGIYFIVLQICIVLSFISSNLSNMHICWYCNHIFIDFVLYGFAKVISINGINFCNQFIIFSLFNSIIFYTSLNLLKSIRKVNNLSAYDLSKILFKLLKPLDTFFNLSISNLSWSDFKRAKF